MHVYVSSVRFSLHSGSLFIAPRKFSFTAFVNRMTLSTDVKEKWFENKTVCFVTKHPWPQSGRGLNQLGGKQKDTQNGETVSHWVKHCNNTPTVYSDKSMLLLLGVGGAKYWETVPFLNLVTTTEFREDFQGYSVCTPDTFEKTTQKVATRPHLPLTTYPYFCFYI